MSTLFSDAFGGVNGVTVQSYSAGYHLITGYSVSLYIYDGVVRTTNTAAASSYGYFNDDIAPFADGIVSVDYVCQTVLATAYISVIGRCQSGSATFMMLLYDTSAATLQIAKRVSNSQTLLGSPVSFSMTPGTTQRFSLKMDGDQFSGLVDGVEVVPPVTDTTISAAGYPGFRRYDTSPTTATTGIHYDNLSVDTLDAAGAVTHTSTGAIVSSSATIAATSARTGSVVTHASTGALVSGSSVIAATSARSSAIASFSTPPIKNNAGTARASTSGWTLNVFNPSTGELVVQKTGLSTDGSGVISVSDAALVSGTSYSYEPVHATYGRGLPIASAA